MQTEHILLGRGYNFSAATRCAFIADLREKVPMNLKSASLTKDKDYRR